LRLRQPAPNIQRRRFDIIQHNLIVDAGSRDCQHHHVDRAPLDLCRGHGGQSGRPKSRDRLMIDIDIADLVAFAGKSFAGGLADHA
jgi:hypothetical protein